MNRYQVFTLFALLCARVSIVAEQAEPHESSLASTANQLTVLQSVTESKALENGIEIRSGNAAMQITALREDILRVRVASQGSLPEDASWAVLAHARAEKTSVANEDNSVSVGFHTTALRVRIDRATARMQVTDLNGTIVQQDAANRPIEFHGPAFRVYKTMRPEEHYFGLGDKPGPLDRRDHAYNLWNTDSYGFQESTDPIYKAIPFFLTSFRGITTGVLFDNTWRTNFDFGKELADAYSFGSENGPLDYYIIFGPDARNGAISPSSVVVPRISAIPVQLSPGIGGDSYSGTTSQGQSPGGRYLSGYRLSGPSSAIYRQPDRFSSFLADDREFENAEFSRCRHHRSAHREPSQRQLLSLRQRDRRGSLRKKSRRLGLCR